MLLTDRLLVAEVRRKVRNAKIGKRIGRRKRDGRTRRANAACFT